MPGNASGGMDGLAVKPLTVDFHEGSFLSKLNQENQFGFWFQLSGDEKKQAGSPWGPSNPQALNRYSYVQNNPVRWNDPSGHWTIGLSLGGIAGGGYAVRGSVSVAIEFTNFVPTNVGVFAGGGGGGMQGIVAGGGLGVTITNAPSIENLKGLSTQIGGQIGVGPAVSGEIVITPNGKEKPFVGVSVGGRIAAEFLGEGHVTTQYDVGVTATDVANGFVHLSQGMKGIVDEGYQRLHRYTHPTLP